MALPCQRRCDRLGDGGDRCEHDAARRAARQVAWCRRLLLVGGIAHVTGYTVPMIRAVLTLKLDRARPCAYVGRGWGAPPGHSHPWSRGVRGVDPSAVGEPSADGSPLRVAAAWHAQQRSPAMPR